MEQLLITFALVAFFVASLSFKLIKDGKAAKIGCGGGSKGSSCATCASIGENSSSCNSCDSKENDNSVSCKI